jgi:beta-glucosidase
MRHAVFVLKTLVCAFALVLPSANGLLVAQTPAAAESGSISPDQSACRASKGIDLWRDSSQSPECRAAAMIRAMSLEEKMRQLSGSADKQQQERYGVPQLHASDGPNGMAMGPVPMPPGPMAIGITAFPNEIVLAASWDRALAVQYGKALGEEWRGKGSLEIIGPTLNLMRTWHWGRSAETYGEDPYLAGALATEEVKGIQSQHVAAMIKHFTGNNQDTDRIGHFPDYKGIDEAISEKALQEIYYGAWRPVVKNANPAAVMCAYNQINGTFACNNEPVQKQLRAWGLQGYIIPDAVFAMHDSAAAIRAGIDDVGPAPVLQNLLAKKSIDEATIDRMLFHVLVPIFRVGLYDDRSIGSASARVTTPEHVALSQSIIEQGAVLLKNRSRVLPLDAGKVKNIVLIGVAAGPQAIYGEQGPTVFVEKLSIPAEAIAKRAGAGTKVDYRNIGAGIRPLTNVPADVLTPESGSGHGLTAAYFKSGDRTGQPVLTRVDATVDFHQLPATELGQQIPSFSAPTMSWSARWAGTLLPPTTGDYVFSLHGGGTARLTLADRTIVELQKVNFQSTSFGAIHLEAGKPVKLVLEHSNDYAVMGSELQLGWYPPHPAEYDSALDAAAKADVAVVFAAEQLGEGMDKRALNLPGNQDALIEAVAARNPHTVVVLNTSTPVAMPWIDQVDAVLESWFPGQESGAGIAAVLFGDVEPGGRLPMTFPATENQGPGAVPEEYPGVNGVAHYNEGVLIGYRYYDQHQQTPLFPFGYGLSYTDFALGNLKVDRVAGAIAVQLTVKNTGARVGSDVVEVYVEEPSDAQEPPSQLKGFEKVSLQPGESRQITIQIPVDNLAVWSEGDHAWKLFAGSYRIKVGESSRNIALSAAFTLDEHGSTENLAVESASEETPHSVADRSTKK